MSVWRRQVFHRWTVGNESPRLGQDGWMYNFELTQYRGRVVALGMLVTWGMIYDVEV